MKINQRNRTLLGMDVFTEEEFIRSAKELAGYYGIDDVVFAKVQGKGVIIKAFIRMGDEENAHFTLEYYTDGTVVVEEPVCETEKKEYLGHFWEVVNRTFRQSRLPKLHAFARERFPDFRQTDYFLIDNQVSNTEQAFRNAVDEFLMTEDGKEMIEVTDGDFNWGDAIVSVPANILEHHGIQEMKDAYCYENYGAMNVISVSQDERLVTDKHLADII